MIEIYNYFCDYKQEIFYYYSKFFAHVNLAQSVTFFLLITIYIMKEEYQDQFTNLLGFEKIWYWV